MGHFPLDELSTNFVKQLRDKGTLNNLILANTKWFCFAKWGPAPQKFEVCNLDSYKELLGLSFLISSYRCSLPEFTLEKNQIELLGEVLKVLFNITMVVDQEKPPKDVKTSCDTVIIVLRHLLIKCKQLPDEPKNLQNNVINTLINLPYQSYEFLYWEIPKNKAREMRKKFEANHSHNEHPFIFEVSRWCWLLKFGESIN